MYIIDFRFAYENVLCEVTADIDEEKINELQDSMQSYMDNVIGEGSYSPTEVVDAVMKESGLNYRILCYDRIIFVE